MLFEKPFFCFVLWLFYFIFSSSLLPVSLQLSYPCIKRGNRTMVGKVFLTVSLWFGLVICNSSRPNSLPCASLKCSAEWQGKIHATETDFSSRQKYSRVYFFIFFKGYKTLSLFPVLTAVRGCQEARCPGNRCNEPRCFPPGRRAAPRGLAPHGHLRALSALLLV